jgi:hypothetical protein
MAGGGFDDITASYCSHNPDDSAFCRNLEADTGYRELTGIVIDAEVFLWILSVDEITKQRVLSEVGSNGIVNFFCQLTVMDC